MSRLDQHFVRRRVAPIRETKSRRTNTSPFRLQDAELTVNSRRFEDERRMNGVFVATELRASAPAREPTGGEGGCQHAGSADTGKGSQP